MDPPEHIASHEEKTHRNIVVSYSFLGFSMRVIENIRLVTGISHFSALIAHLGTPSKSARNRSDSSRLPVSSSSAKPRLRPVPLVSSTINAGQGIFPRKGRGIRTEHLLKREWRSESQAREIPIISPDLDSGIAPDSRLRRLGTDRNNRTFRLSIGVRIPP